VRPDKGSYEQRKMLDAIGVRSFDALELVELSLGDLSRRDCIRAKLAEVVPWADIVVETVVLF
jgi:hypothetical protein